MKIRRRFGFSAMIFIFVMFSATAGIVRSAPLFDAAGALLSDRGGMLLPGNEHMRAHGNRDAAPWNRWTVVGDQLDDQYDNPDLAIDSSGTIRCVFAGYEDTFFSKDILYAVSGDANESWTNPNIVAAHTTTNRHLMYPDFAKVTDTDVWIVYSQYNESMNGLDVKFIRSGDGGTSFSSPVQISDDTPDGAYNAYPNAVADGNDIYVVWLEWNDDATCYVRFSHSSDGGLTWPSGDSAVNDSAHAREGHDQPTIGLDESIHRLYVAWATDDGRVVVAWSDDGGATWPGLQQVNDNTEVSAEEADIFVDDSGRIYVVWCDLRNGEDLDTFIVKSTDHGATWSAPVKVNDDVTSGNQYEPHLFKDAAGTLHVVYLFNVPMGTAVDVYYNQSTDDGATWMPQDSRVNNVQGYAGPDVPCSTDIVADASGAAYIAWCDTQDWSQLICTSNVTDNTPTPTPTSTPTTSLTPTATPTATPTDTPTQEPTPPVTGVEIRMPSHNFRPGDECACTALVSNTTGDTLSGYPLFVILDIGGELFFAPEFNEFSCYDQDFPPGLTEVVVLPPFDWPTGAGAFTGAYWYGALTTPDISALFGEMDVFEFGWSD